MTPVDPSAFHGLPLLYGALAGCCMVLAIRFTKQAIAPLAEIIRAAAALAGVGLAASAAVVFVAAALLMR